MTSVVALALLAAAPAAALDFSLSIAGGISLGAYEAGFNWALVRLVKAQHWAALDAAYGDACDTPGVERPPGIEESELRTLCELRRRGYTFRTFPGAGGDDWDLAAVTGASAGNINAFVSAAEWCQHPLQDAKTPPEKSWYWRAWVELGLETLFPQGRSCASYAKQLGLKPEQECKDTTEPYRSDDGVLSRRAFRPIRDAFTEYARGESDASRFIPNCRVPIGVTVTRVAPTALPLSEYGFTVPAVRYVVPVRARTNAAGDRLDFQDLFTSGEEYEFDDFSDLGPLLRLPTQSSDHKTLSYDDIFSLNEASSAFPIAFGTSSLRYCTSGDDAKEPATLDEGWTCEMPRKKVRHKFSPTSARFLDGGVFDNNPLGLALALAEEPAETRFLYIDPDRRSLWGATDTAPRIGDFKGVKYFERVVPTWVSVARSYEMQIVARSEEAEAGAISMRPSSRYSLVFGEQLAAFGAFLARPFREHDFYVGAYDALVYLAGESCAQAEPEAKAECTGERLRAATELLMADQPGLTEEPAAAPAPVAAQAPGLVQNVVDTATDVYYGDDDKFASSILGDGFDDRDAVPLTEFIVRRLLCDEAEMSRDLAGRGVDAPVRFKLPPADGAWACNASTEERAGLTVPALYAASRDLDAEWRPLSFDKDAEKKWLEARDPFQRLLDKLRDKNIHALMRKTARARDAEDEPRWLSDELNSAANLIEGPEAWTDEETSKIARRLTEIEVSDGNAMTAAGMVIAQYGLAYRELIRPQRGIWIRPSTFPSAHARINFLNLRFSAPLAMDTTSLGTITASVARNTWALVAPNYVAVDMAHGGGELGWRLAQGWFGFTTGAGAIPDVGVGATVHTRWRPDGVADDSVFFGGGVHAALRWGANPFTLIGPSQVDIGPRFDWRAVGCPRATCQPTVGGEVGVRLLLDMVRLSVAWRDLSSVTRPEPANVALTNNLMLFLSYEGLAIPEYWFWKMLYTAGRASMRGS